MNVLFSGSTRHADAAALARALQATRERTLGLFDAWLRAYPDGRIPHADTLNPPLWELGHVGWFQEWWIGRNRQRARGPACEPDHARGASHVSDADAFYDSSHVAHATRWTLPLPDVDATLGYLAQVQADTLALLQAAGAGDDDLYFWRLVLLHEAMHNEAAVYMAQQLGVPIPPELATGHAGARTAHEPGVHGLPAQTWRMGAPESGFCFDNERVGTTVELAAFEIDAAPVSWARYLPFVQATGHRLPPHVRPDGSQWLERRFGQWMPLDVQAAAVHLSWDDARAWCDWAGRRLPTEAEWDCAAHTVDGFGWGAVWEWTDSWFEPYDGFVAHPYRDYSEPWFGSRRVLRGACAATSATLISADYRNFFTPERRDIFAGFRSAR